MVVGARGARLSCCGMEPLKVGDTAPEFDLPIFGQERAKLSDALQKGPVVLLTYVFDFTGG